MRKLAWYTSFRRAFRRYTRNNPGRKEEVFQVLEQLATDPFQPSLRTHKLTGQLHGLWACWVEYDCRIIFAFEPDPSSGEELIVLIDLGSHDEVY
jgi:addiction module RelE/StbE family toxin